jgi:hypothetical protein
MKTIVEFKWDIDKDLYNIWETANSTKTYGYDFKRRLTKNILKICNGKSYRACNKKLREEMKEMYKNTLFKYSLEYFNDIWKKVEKDYFRRLEKVTNRKFPFKKVNAYLTTAGRCPYRYHWRPPAYYVNFFGNVPSILHISGHEIMHIHLHNTDWWKKVEKELGNRKTHDLKEALTELLNLEFKDIWIMKDEPYPDHRLLRNYISQQWKKEKNFDKLTEDCIKWIQKKGVK